MKKLAYIILLILAAPLYADTITTGNLKLLRPTPGAMDSRSWGDKLNSNFQIIDSTVSSNQVAIAALGVATGNIAGSIYVSILSTYSALTSTGVSLSNLWTVSKSTWDAFTNFTSTTQAQIVTINSTITAISNSTSTISGTLAQRTVVGYNAGSALTGGNITAINVTGAGGTASQSNSTLTITLTGGGGSGGASGSTTAASGFTVIIGTPGTPGIDVPVSNLSDFNAALATFGACGLTTSATAYGRIFVKSGEYQVMGATIPRGVELIAASSAVWSAANGTQNILKVFGKVDGMKFDLSNQPYTGRMVWVSSGGRFLNNQIYNAENLQSASQRFASALFTDGADLVVQGNTIKDIKAVDGIAYYGDLAPIVLTSTGLVFKDNVINYTGNAASLNSTSFSIWGATYVAFTGNQIYNLAQNGISFNSGCRDISILNNFIEVRNFGGAPDNGLFMSNGTGNRGAVISSGVIIANNLIIYNTPNAGGIFVFTPSVATAQVTGVVITGNMVDNTSANGLTFANLGTGSQNTVITNNHVLSHGSSGVTFVSDSGAGTKYASQLNFVNGIQQ